MLDRNENIKEAILSMQGSLLALGDKLQRHEYRSNHVGEQTLQSLRRLDGARAGADKNMENIAVQLGRMDVRIAKMEKVMEQVCPSSSFFLTEIDAVK